MCSHTAIAQNVDYSEKKSAYILNFLKHVEWEQDQDLKSIKIAVYGDTSMYRILKSLAFNKTIREKTLSVSFISNQLNLANFQVIVVSSDNNSNCEDIYKRYFLNRLIITSEASLKYSMINFDVKDNKLQFELNESNLSKAKIQTSEYLKGVSISDVDILRAKILETDKKAELAREAIKNQEAIIEAQKKEAKSKLEELARAEKNLALLVRDGDSLKNNIQNQKNNLFQLQSQIFMKEDAIRLKELQLSNLLKEQGKRNEMNEKQRNEIALQNKTIQENIAYLETLKDQIKTQKETIVNRETVVQKQRFTIIIVGAGLFFIVILSIFIFRSNRIKHHANIILEEKNKQILKQSNELELKSEKLTKAIFELKVAQNHLITSEKMAALGGMVAGVAHEINTPVGIGVTAMSHLQSKYHEFMSLFEKGEMKKSDLIKFLEVVNDTTSITEHNLNRAALLVQNFKQVSVDQSSEDKRTIFIEQYIRDIITNLIHEFKHTKIEINVVCLSDFEIDTYPGAISQIITNFLMNAKFHAFEKNQKGEVLIEIVRQQKDYIIMFSDNGKGIPEENIGKIFEPFYTTRRNEGGSGLGLSIVHNIVTNQLQGDINVESTKDKGTKFTLTLPLNIA